MRSKTPKYRGSFVLRFPNGRKRRYRTQEDVDEVKRVIGRGRFKGVGEMWAAIQSVPNGFAP